MTNKETVLAFVDRINALVHLTDDLSDSRLGCRGLLFLRPAPAVAYRIVVTNLNLKFSLRSLVLNLGF
jgi:hypothetical protein